ncbi:MAG: histidinol-phosphate transaminase [Myxococcota bacterium]
MQRSYGCTPVESTSTNFQPTSLHLNENALGPSRAAQEASRCATTIHRYPTLHGQRLVDALAQRHGISPAGVIVGAGSDALLRLIAAAWLVFGDEVVMPAHPFIALPIAVCAAGGRPVRASAPSPCPSVDALLAAVGPRTSMVMLSNPHNPTGTVLPRSEIERLREGLPRDVVLVLDGAYAEYVQGDYTTGIGMPGTIAVGTFSKIYALAALRVGWMAASPEIAARVRAISPFYPISAVAEQTAIAALGDDAHVHRSATHAARMRTWAARTLRAIGLDVTPGAANFLMVRCADLDQASRLQHAAAAAGVQIASCAGYALPSCLRITMGTHEEMRVLFNALQRAR